MNEPGLVDTRADGRERTCGDVYLVRPYPVEYDHADLMMYYLKYLPY